MVERAYRPVLRTALRALDRPFFYEFFFNRRPEKEAAVRKPHHGAPSGLASPGFSAAIFLLAVEEKNRRWQQKRTYGAAAG